MPFLKNQILPTYLHPKAVVQTWRVPHFMGGIRADQYLVYKIGRLSRTRAQNLIISGDFRSVQGSLKASRRFFGGEAVQLWRMPPDEAPLTLKKIDVLFENDDFIVINKPADLVIHPTARHLYQTLTHWFLQKYPINTPHPCHRLDRETSGVLIAARNKKTQSYIKSSFMHGKIGKTYLAIVRGNIKNPLHITWPLALQGDRGLVRTRMIRDDETGLASETNVQPLQYYPDSDRTLVECRPKTGRQHQIRAHLSLAGFPIVGDKLYAMGDEYFDAFTQNKALKRPDHHRQALHAHTLSFELFGKDYTFTAPLPNDLLSLLIPRNLS
jgi:23S rRNA pseudouridine1911/1915/1917 synthase